MSIHDEPVFTAPIEHDVDEHTIQPSDDSYVPNPLFQNLVPETPQTRTLDGKLSFADAMPRLGYSSVFDIIRQPKQAFARQVRSLSDADGEMAYDNALCYATQIARSYREEQVSSGRSLPQIAPQTGVRALVDVGPSYPNLFKENWDQFCKVGAIEAMDGPVAYLGSLRRFAEQRIEGASTSPKRIPLAVRRPDLDKLVIDEQSTYQSRPMLDLVNDVLTQGIGKYQAEKGDVRPVHQLLAEKKHPFVFPYHFAHQQVSLALSGEKPKLGEINYRLRQALLGSESSVQAGEAQAALCGLSPSLEKLITAPSLFSHFYIGLRNLLDGAIFAAPSTDAFRAPLRHSASFLLKPQTGVASVVPEASAPIWAEAAGRTNSQLVFNQAQNAPKQAQVDFIACDLPYGQHRPMNQAIVTDGSFAKSLLVAYPGDDAALAELVNYRCDVSVDAMAWLALGDWVSPPRQLAPWRFTFIADPDYALTPDEQAFFQAHYGVTFTHCSANPMVFLDGFLQASGIDSEALEALLAIKAYAPTQSANFIATNRATAGSTHHRGFPLPNHYGACYVNGVGGSDTGTRDYNNYDNSMGVAQAGASQKWHLTNTSLERFDRLQRMVRLQKATGLPYAQLDALIIAAMHSEGDANSALEINANTLRALGVYRYFNQHYRLEAEEFAAFIHALTPYATTGQVSVLDKVFNTPVLFDTALVIDDAAFSLTSDAAADRRTVAQLCASLNVEPGEELALIVAETLTFVTPLKRSLSVVSSLYRQARIAQLFGLSIKEYWTLCEWLGGSTYRRVLASGRLKAQDSTDKDILDVLMELDQAVRWLKTNKLTVTALSTMLTEPLAGEAEPSVLQRLELMASDARSLSVTATSVAALNLPSSATGAVIDWFAKLRGGAQPLIDGNGLINTPPLMLTNDDHAHLDAQVVALIGTLGLAADVIEKARTALTQFLFSALTRQQRLVEGLLAEQTGLLPELATLAARGAQVSPQLLLTQALEAWPTQTPQDETAVTALLSSLQQVSLSAQAVVWSNLGPRALRAFLAHPGWLGTATLWPQTLHTLHLLKAYESLFNTLGQPEERLLGYLELANTTVSKRPGKRQLATQAEHCNAAAASLLGWNVDDVAALTATLPQGIAKTVAHLDWLRRAQAIALQTGLNGATLLQACALNADSPEADWQAVGQAAMAAVSA
ncbi:hypothetical protein IFT69_03535 [Pseudomonas putida]|nr:hypothetical protein [Pseudomonas putida]